MDFESILSTNSNTPAGGPNSNGQLFGPTNVSRNPTSPRRATEMMRGAVCVQWTSSRSRASVTMVRISVEALVNMFRVYR